MDRVQWPGGHGAAATMNASTMNATMQLSVSLSLCAGLPAGRPNAPRGETDGACDREESAAPPRRARTVRLIDLERRARFGRFGCDAP